MNHHSGFTCRRGQHRVWRSLAVATGAIALTLGLLPARSYAFTNPVAAKFSTTVSQIEALPYQPNYIPAGLDSAFPGQTVPNTLPAEDYTSGSIPGSPDLPNWPSTFKQVTIKGSDGDPLVAEVALLPGYHPGIEVVHGFNTHGIASVIRWAAMLRANGYNVIAADQRDFSYEYGADKTYPSKWPQTFGWKESQDILATGRYLRAQRGITSLGIVGFSEGAQNTMLALHLDSLSRTPIYSAGLTFSAPTDQDTQIYSTAVPANCQTPSCTYPATDALIALVVPPYSYSDPCQVLNAAAAVYHVTPYSIMTHESAMHAQTTVKVPLLNFYSADDSLVSAGQAAMTAAYESGNPLQKTLEISRGEHAYFFDRWWQQAAILTYFHNLLPSASTAGTTPTVNQTTAGSTFRSQEVAIPQLSRAQADSELAPFICDTTLPPPGRYWQ